MKRAPWATWVCARAVLGKCCGAQGARQGEFCWPVAPLSPPRSPRALPALEAAQSLSGRTSGEVGKPLAHIEGGVGTLLNARPYSPELGTFLCTHRTWSEPARQNGNPLPRPSVSLPSPHILSRICRRNRSLPPKLSASQPGRVLPSPHLCCSALLGIPRPGHLLLSNWPPFLPCPPFSCFPRSV